MAHALGNQIDGKGFALSPDWLTVRRLDQRLAVIGNGVSWTYQQLYLRATLLAGQLAANGVQAGDRVAVLARQPLVFAAVLHAARYLKAVLVPLNTRLAPAELAWQVSDSGVAVLVCDAAHEHGAGFGIPTICLDGLRWDDSHAPIDRSHIELAAVQSIVYTSGTTGRPKGALITYANHFYGATASAFRLGVEPGERWLTPLPLFHVGGMAVLMRTAIYGTAAVLHEVFDAIAVNREIDEGQVSLLSVVPVMLSLMLQERGARPYPPRLRCVLLGGGAAPRSLLDRCVELGVPVSQSYGLTEANSQVATLAPGDGRRKLGSSGQPLLLTEVRIVDDAGRDSPCHVPGEILVRGPTISHGYYQNPDASQRAFADGWFRTGDIGYLDEEDYLYVLDRRNDLIVSGGENIYPAEVEAVLLSHPDIMEAGVTGVADERFGQVPLAVVKRRDSGLAAETLQAFCRDQLAGYKVPRHIRFVEDLPRNAAGKLLRRELGRWL